MRITRRIIAFILTCAILLGGCSSRTDFPANDVTGTMESVVNQESASESSYEEMISSIEESGSFSSEKSNEELNIPYKSMEDRAFLDYIENSVYDDLNVLLASHDFIVEDVEAVYYPKEYIEALVSNTQANVYFGYTTDQLNEYFNGKKYVFTLSEEGNTIVIPMETYTDDAYVKMMEDVIVGAGVILLCVTVTSVTAPFLPAVSVTFAASAATAKSFALNSSIFSFATAAAIAGYETEDFEQAIKAGLQAGTKGFKYGAISGAVLGGTLKGGELIIKETKRVKALKAMMEGVDEARKAELRALIKYGGDDQVSFLAGKTVPRNTPGSTRPDVVRVVGDHLEAIEVKYYNLESEASLSTLYKELTREVSDRVANMPPGTTQRIVLDVTGRGFDKAIPEAVKKTIIEKLATIYKDIPVDIVGL